MPPETVAEEIARDAAEEVGEEVGGLEDAALEGLVRTLMPGARRLAAFDAEDRQSGRAAGHRREWTDQPGRSA